MVLPIAGPHPQRNSKQQLQGTETYLGSPQEAAGIEPQAPENSGIFVQHSYTDPSNNSKTLH